MKLKQYHSIRQVSIIGLILILLMTALPLEVQAASRGKTAKKYTITIHNANSDTVIRKGGKLKLKCSAVAKDGTRRKVRYRSSNRKVATVSKKGVIRAKRKGTVKITVYCKARPKNRKTIKIRVGTPVSSIRLSGYNYLNKGRTTYLNTKFNSGATNKKISWSTSDSKVATVNSSGKVTAKGYGTATITAKALDGSGTRGSIDVIVHKYTKDDANWIAHRGLHTKYTENTYNAFEAAGVAGFWGCECDIWETAHETVTTASVMSAAASDQDEQLVTNPESDPEKVEGEEKGNEISVQEDAKEAQILTDTAIEAKGVPAETFDIVINHDETFKRTMGVNREVRKMTAREIREKVPKACFFEEYLDICNQHGMVPVVEFKDPSMSNEAIHKAIDMLDAKGLLDDAYLISFYTRVLEEAKLYSADKLGYDPYTAYLISSENLSAVDHAAAKGYTCISVTKACLSKNLYNKCIAAGLKVGTWTYKEYAESDYYLYKHTISGQYDIDFATVDYKPF